MKGGRGGKRGKGREKGRRKEMDAPFQIPEYATGYQQRVGKTCHRSTTPEQYHCSVSAVRRQCTFTRYPEVARCSQQNSVLYRENYLTQSATYNHFV